MKENDFKKTLGKKIRTLRELTRTTQMDLAKSLGMTSTGAISQVESGSKGMTVENIHGAAKFFGVHPAVLFSPIDMDKTDLAIMQVLMDRIEHKATDSRKARDYAAISHLVLSVNNAS